MKLAILHLSDAHIAGATDPILGRGAEILAALRAQASGDTAVLIVVSGDVAYSGSKSQYELAQGFVKGLTEGITGLPNVTLLGAVAVPGNHDCDFTAEGDARPGLMGMVAANLGSYDLAGESMQQLLKVQDSFFDFESSLSGRARPTRERISSRSYFSYNGRVIGVLSLNTALFSRLSEKAGQLYFPFGALAEEGAPTDFSLTILHHPYPWLDPMNGRELRRRVESVSDLVLTGHEHDGDSYLRIDRQGEETGYVEGLALQAKGPTGFNIVLVDFETETNQIYRYTWCDDLYQPDPARAYLFARKQSLIRSHFENNPEFSHWLNDLGTGFIHPEKKDLTLRDLFVYPDLKVASISSKSKTEVPSSGVFEYVSEKGYLQIAGAPTSGKSTLARALYLDFQRLENRVPVILTGPDLHGSSPQQFEGSIRRAFVKQYREAQWERFRQQSSDRKVLIIDDWHGLRLPKKSRTQILEAAATIFGKIVLLSADVSLLQMLTDSNDGPDNFPTSEYCEIKQFGYRLRSELIRRWHALGPSLGDDLEVTSRVSASENVIDTLVRKGIVPSWPVFILSVLQTTSTTLEETAAYGSYGHLYEALLTRRMAASSRRQNLLGFKFTYLSNVAYELFQSGRTSISARELRQLHRRYEDEYQITVDEGELWEELTAAQVLARSGDEYRFQYKYAYYFFVAKYFQQGISNAQETAALRQTLDMMVRCVHDEEFSNILIFYLYLSKDRELIERMLGVASQILSEQPSANLSADLEFVNDLRQKAPEIVISNRDIDKNRDEYRSRLDESEQAEEVQAVPTEQIVRTEYADGISVGLKIAFAFQSLQVMGQVLKNFPLDLRGDLKVRLTESSYQLTLRTLSVFLGGLAANVGELVQMLESALRRFAPFAKKSNEELREAAGAAMVRITELSIFGMIKRLSLAVGVADLDETYSRVREMLGEQNIPGRLIDLSLRLDHFGYIPEDDVKELADMLEDNFTANAILKFLIADHLHLFPCDYKVEQRMIQLFKFRPHVLRLGDKRFKKKV